MLPRTWHILLLIGTLTPLGERGAFSQQDARRSPRTPATSTSEPTATVHWDRVPLSDAVSRLSAALDQTVLIDRRVDPMLPVSVTAQSATAAQILDEAAADAELAIGRIGPLIVLSKPQSADELMALITLRRNEIAGLPVTVRRSLRQSQQLAWPTLTEPRRLVGDLLAQRGWQLQRSERIPHDLWPAGELPDMAIVDQLTVLLWGFDLTYRIEPAERTIELLPVERPLIVGEGAGPSEAEPATTLRPAASDRRARSRGERAAGPTRQVYTLRVQDQPVGTVSRELARRLGWTIDVDETAIRAAGLSLERRVSFAVENADRDELLEALLKPAGLEHHEEGDRLRIRPRNRR